MTNSFEVNANGCVLCRDGRHEVTKTHDSNGVAVKIDRLCGFLQITKIDGYKTLILLCDEEGAPLDENGNYRQCGMPREQV